MGVPLLGGILSDLAIATPHDTVNMEITVRGAWPSSLSSPLAVEDCAVASVAACLAAAADLAVAQGRNRPQVELDRGHVAAVMRSEAWLRDASGHGAAGFAPLSRLWPTADGWVRTHANYPWHRKALLDAFGIPDGDDAAVAPQLAKTLAKISAADVEEVAQAAGALAVAARTAEGWQATEAGAAAARRPLIVKETLTAAAQPLPTPGPLPASGIRVLDLTRVIAGPVGTRMLAALGADVLRLDDPRRPELPFQAIDGVVGKASATLDLATHNERVHELLALADLLVTGYRPGALRRFGLDPDQVAERHPGVSVVTLSAWGTKGPWGSRRGFDSLVQIASGVGWATSADGDRPGALPFQLLDHGTGYLIAAAALAALSRRARTGETTHSDLSLAATALWLLRQGIRPLVAEPPPASEDDVVDYRTPLGDGWSGIAPAGRLDDRPLGWPRLPPRYGRAQPAWVRVRSNLPPARR
jgi:crotonobetainyl-CoA:carnitine CoA-transferase CaiB-like acyl-CoA transferase